MTTTLNMRIDSKLKQTVSRKFKKSGLNLSSGTKYIFTQIANGEIELTPKMHYDLTPKQEKWLENQIAGAKKGKKYSNIRELHRDILGK